MEMSSEFDKLCERFTDPEFRASISTTLGDAAEDIDFNQFPDDVRDTLQGLSREEVEVLARVRMTLEAANIPDMYKLCLV